MTLLALKQLIATVGAERSVASPLKLSEVPVATREATSTSRALMARPAGAVFERHVRWGTEADGESRKRIASGTRPAGLFFSTLDWNGSGGGPTEHQQAQTVDNVFAAFNWT